MLFLLFKGLWRSCCGYKLVELLLDYISIKLWNQQLHTSLILYAGTYFGWNHHILHGSF